MPRGDPYAEQRRHRIQEPWNSGYMGRISQASIGNLAVRVVRPEPGLVRRIERVRIVRRIGLLLLGDDEPCSGWCRRVGVGALKMLRGDGLGMAGMPEEMARGPFYGAPGAGEAGEGQKSDDGEEEDGNADHKELGTCSGNRGDDDIGGSDDVGELAVGGALGHGTEGGVCKRELGTSIPKTEQVFLSGVWVTLRRRCEPAVFALGTFTRRTLGVSFSISRGPR